MEYWNQTASLTTKWRETPLPGETEEGCESGGVFRPRHRYHGVHHSHVQIDRTESVEESWSKARCPTVCDQVAA